MLEAQADRGWSGAADEALLVVDTPDGLARAVAERSGRAISVAADPATAVTHLAEHGGYAAVLAGAAGAVELAKAGVRAIIIAGPEAIEEAEAALSMGAVDVLPADANHEEIERVLGVARRAVRETSHLSGANLAELSAEASRIAKALESLSRAEAGPRTGPAVTAGYVRGVIRARRARANFFHGELFADPAWDILLDLMAARLEGRRVSVSSLCIAAAVPPTTALRWIKSMTDQGLLERKPDPVDGRRIFIDLSEAAADSMLAFLSQAAKGAAPAI